MNFSAGRQLPIEFPTTHAIHSNHPVVFVDVLDLVNTLARWLENPWTLYIAAGVNPAFEVRFRESDPTYTESPRFYDALAELMQIMWREAVERQPNDLLGCIRNRTQVMRILAGERVGNKIYLADVPIADWMDTLLDNLPDSADIRVWVEEISYDEYLKSGSWAITRLAAKRLANFQCSVCAAKSNLNVHHRPDAYKRLGIERMSDVTTLCRKHHAMFHGKPIHSLN